MTRLSAPSPLADPECQFSPMPPQCELLPEEPVCREPARGEPEPPLCERASPSDAFSLEDGSFEALASRLQQLPMADRVECISRRFLSLPYAPDPLGEGETGDVDRDPLFAFDAADCMTLVETILAVAHARNADDFRTILSAIRYRGGIESFGMRNNIESFGMRNHFVEADWIPNNARRGLIRDITALVGGRQTQQMSMVIDRMRWMEQRKDLPLREKTAAAFDLWESHVDQPEWVSMSYIPIAAFLVHGSRNGIAPRILERMPEVSIAVFLRQPDAAQRIGVMVAHMGLVIVPHDRHGRPMTPILRHASSAKGAIVDEPLDHYLEENASRRAGVALLQISD